MPLILKSFILKKEPFRKQKNKDNFNKLVIKYKERGARMPKVATDIPDNLYKKIEEEVRRGIFTDVSEAINAALKKAYAKKSRAYLRWLIKKEGITEAAMLKELENIRR